MLTQLHIWKPQQTSYINISTKCQNYQPPNKIIKYFNTRSKTKLRFSLLDDGVHKTNKFIYFLLVALDDCFLRLCFFCCRVILGSAINHGSGEIYFKKQPQCRVCTERHWPDPQNNIFLSCLPTLMAFRRKIMYQTYNQPPGSYKLFNIFTSVPEHI